MNTLAITGNLVGDPEKVTLANGSLLANFRVGNTEYVNGQPKDNGFFDITCFGTQAENVLSHLHKGQRVVIAGRLQHRTFEREDGSKGGRINIVATAIGLSLEFKEKTES